MLNIENISNGESEQSRTSASSPQTHNETQRENEEQFNMLQIEMSSLKAMREHLLKQKSEKVRQVNAAPNNVLIYDAVVYHDRSQPDSTQPLPGLRR